MVTVRIAVYHFTSFRTVACVIALWRAHTILVLYKHARIRIAHTHVPPVTNPGVGTRGESNSRAGDASGDAMSGDEPRLAGEAGGRATAGLDAVRTRAEIWRNFIAD
jgi:hypothetical protein